MTPIIIGALALVQLYVVFAALYTYYPMVGALLDRFRPRREEGMPASPPPRMAVLIAAHNEEAVIGGAVQALMQQRFPAAGYDVFVVADNCSDRTAQEARRAGATVYERFSNAELKTKGRALAWMWQHVRFFDYGAVVVLDADNHADPGFLMAIGTELGRGHQVVQGIRRTKRHDAGAVADLDGITELCTHRIGAAGKQRLGLGGPLMGSGVAFAAPVFERLIADVGETVVEDCEWQARLAEDGTEIRWAPNAVVYDEKTANPEAMARQRERWVGGRGQVARAHVLPCLKAFLTRGNLTALDMVGHLVTPPRVLMLGGLAGFLLLSLLGVPGVWSPVVWLLGLLGFVAYVLLALWLDGAPRASYLRLASAALQLPRFALTMLRAQAKALMGARPAWVPTPHGHQEA